MDDFNKRFEGEYIPGSSRPETRKTDAMLHCVLRENFEEFTVRLEEAIEIFQAEKVAAENRERDRGLGRQERPAR